MSIETLSKHPFRVAPEGPVITVVMDGIGFGRGDESDAVALGNSEVGHNAIGAGRVFEQGASLVADAIESGRIFEGECWKRATQRVRASQQPLHFIGLLSDGNVHSHIDHLLAMLDRAASEGVQSVRVHALLDGRDVPVRSALTYIDRLEARLAEIASSGLDYQVASGGGRMTTTMDRYEADWAMVERGWKHHVLGQGRQFPGLRVAVETLYGESELGDQDLEPFVIASGGEPVGPIRDGASVVFFNFRGDRGIEISRAFEEDVFDAFARGSRPDVFFAGMMEYDGDTHTPANYLVEPPQIDRTMGELIAGAGLHQVAIAETHKFGHVTYFWNGNRSGAFDESLERYIEVPSDLGPCENQPWMKAAEVTDALIRSLDAGHTDLLRVNYANGDMVGHTGVFESTRMAVEAVDLCLGRLIREVDRRRGVLVVTADHGNADHMFDRVGDDLKIRTSHSLNRVPFVVYDPREEAGAPKRAVGEQGGLGNVAATLLELLGFSAPSDYLPSLLDPAS
jgi:2,3-bisphosphoglycerate-independent phosphoglycerate mutase